MLVGTILVGIAFIAYQRRQRWLMEYTASVVQESKLRGYTEHVTPPPPAFATSAATHSVMAPNAPDAEAEIQDSEI